MKEIITKQLKNFPKKRGCNTIRRRCLQFIEVLKQNGYTNQIPLDEAKTLFMKTMGIMDRTSLNAYFGSQAHRSVRKIQKIARYGTGTTSYKTIELAQEVPQKRGYFEVLGLAKFEQRGSTWFMVLTNEPLVPELFPQHYEGRECSMENLSLSPILPSHNVKHEAEALIGESISRENLGSLSHVETEENNKQTTTYRVRERTNFRGKFLTLNGEKHNEYASICLTPEEEAILKAKPKPKKCGDCGRINVSNPYAVFCPKGYGLRSRSDICVLEGANH